MFKVYANQVPDHLIDALLLSHGRFKKSRFSVFRAQGTTHFELPVINEYGHQVNSIHNPHLLGYSKDFSTGIERIVTHINISKCLADFTGSNDHVWYQSMFFDKSTGTKLHQDSWYLDTVPNGKLVGVWVALEDIEYSAGPFCLYTDSDTQKHGLDDFDFDDIENCPKFQSQYPNSRRFDFTARKGDILIWDSFTIHGAQMPRDASMTRKSITAHFYPSNVPVQAPPISRFFSIYDHSKPQSTLNPHIVKATTIKPFFYQTICAVLFMLEKFQSFKALVMRERSDKVSDIRRIR